MKDVVFNTKDVWCPHCATKYMSQDEFFESLAAESISANCGIKTELECSHWNCGEKFDLEIVTTVKFITSKH